MSVTQIDATIPVLAPGVGYGIVLGMGMGFAALMVVISQVTSRYTEHGASASSEEYTSASRSLKPGLIASGIVSAATWAATLLQASTVCMAFGVSGPWWYGAGSATQIVRPCLPFFFFSRRVSLVSRRWHLRRTQSNSKEMPLVLTLSWKSLVLAGEQCHI